MGMFSWLFKKKPSDGMPVLASSLPAAQLLALRSNFVAATMKNTTTTAQREARLYAAALKNLKNIVAMSALTEKEIAGTDFVTVSRIFYTSKATT